MEGMSFTIFPIGELDSGPPSTQRLLLEEAGVRVTSEVMREDGDIPNKAMAAAEAVERALEGLSRETLELLPSLTAV